MGCKVLFSRCLNFYILYKAALLFLNILILWLSCSLLQTDVGYDIYFSFAMVTEMNMLMLIALAVCIIGDAGSEKKYYNGLIRNCLLADVACEVLSRMFPLCLVTRLTGILYFGMLLYVLAPLIIFSVVLYFARDSLKYLKKRSDSSEIGN